MFGRRFFFRDDGCDGKTTLGVTAELHYEQHVDVYVGMPCSEGSRKRCREKYRSQSVIIYMLQLEMRGNA